MSKKDTYAIIDTETTQTNKVADIGIAIIDRKGNVLARMGVLVKGVFDNADKHPLFYTSDGSKLWDKSGLPARYEAYTEMLNNGSRMMASISAVNRWCYQAVAQYNPVLTAYNLPFDMSKCLNTGIDLSMFNRSFCLWGAAYTAYAHTKAYRDMVVELHAFNAPTSKGNMTFKTNAETMARFCMDNTLLVDEPHTALEDVLFYEKPILDKLLKKYSKNWLLNETNNYSWNDCQVRDWFTSK